MIRVHAWGNLRKALEVAAEMGKVDLDRVRIVFDVDSVRVEFWHPNEWLGRYELCDVLVIEQAVLEALRGES